MKMTGGLYMVTVTTIYAMIALFNMAYGWTRLEYIQLMWMVILSLPLWIKPIARRCNMKTIWE